MHNIFKMDMFRLTHSPVFYVALAFITIMAVALPMSGMTTTLDGALGVSGAAAPDVAMMAHEAIDAANPPMGEDDFMGAMMGAGVISILLGIILSMFISSDYSCGFAKNIFATHVQPKDYIGGKLMSMAVTSGILLVVYTIESIISLLVFTGGVSISGSIFGMIVFLIEKWLLSIALSSVVLFIMVSTRKAAWGIVVGFLIATGGLAMGVRMLADWLGWSWLVSIFSVTISGASALCTFDFSILIFLRVLLASAAWTVGSSILSARALKAKDI